MNIEVWRYDTTNRLSQLSRKSDRFAYPKLMHPKLAESTPQFGGQLNCR